MSTLYQNSSEDVKKAMVYILKFNQLNLFNLLLLDQIFINFRWNCFVIFFFK